MWIYLLFFQSYSNHINSFEYVGCMSPLMFSNRYQSILTKIRWFKLVWRKSGQKNNLVKVKKRLWFGFKSILNRSKNFPSHGKQKRRLLAGNSVCKWRCDRVVCVKRLKTLKTSSLHTILTLELKTPNSHQLQAAIVQLCGDEDIRQSENQVHRF